LTLLEIASTISDMLENSQSVRAWALKNKGAQKIIAKFFGVTQSHVSAVLAGKHYSERGKIEGVLADLGAPGMRQRQYEAKSRACKITWTDREKKRLMDQLRKIQGKGAAA
jgi:predicted XRE-type DNA-binding protein